MPSSCRLQLKELETIAAQKAEEMARLLQQNQDLKFKHSILEKVVTVSTGLWATVRGAAQRVVEPTVGNRPYGLSCRTVRVSSG